MTELTPEEVSKLEVEAKTTAEAKEKPTVLGTNPAPPVREPMSKLQVRSLWAAVIAALAGPFWLMLAPVGYQLGFWGLGTALGKMTRDIAPIIVGVAVVISLIAIVIQLVKTPKRGAIIGVIALMIPIFMGTRLYGVKSMVASLPPIHDIQTDWDNPLQFPDYLIEERKANKWNKIDDNARVPDRLKKSRPEVAGKSNKELQQAYLNSNLRPQIFQIPNELAFEAALEVAEKQGFEIVSFDKDAGWIHATDTTFWYGFVDDVLIQVEKQGDVGSKINMRSVSRIGLSDMGANANRIKKYLDELNLTLKN